MIVKIICSSSVEREEEIGLFCYSIWRWTTWVATGDRWGVRELCCAKLVITQVNILHGTPQSSRVSTAPDILFKWHDGRLPPPPPLLVLLKYSSAFPPFRSLFPIVVGWCRMPLPYLAAVSQPSYNSHSKSSPVHRWKETRLIAMWEQTPLNWLITNYHPLVSLNWLFYCTQLKKNQ